MEAESKHILIVDDEISICEILGQFLQKRGYQITRASTGEEALDIIEEMQINLVITDIKMPGITGVDLLKKIKTDKPEIQVLLTTGFPTLDTAIEALKLGAFDYLTKPFHLEEIGEKVKRAFVSRQMEEENLLFSKLVSLHEITKILSSTLEIEELNTKFLGFCIKMSKSDAGALLFTGADGKLSPTAFQGVYTERSFWLNRHIYSASLWAANSNEPLVIEAGMTELPAGVYPIPAELKSLIVLPLRTPSHTIGVLNLIRISQRESFSSLDLEIVNVLASQASIAIENVRLYYNIRDNYLKTIRAFALAVEAKDEYTHGHSENVMKYTIVLAKHMGLADQEIELVKYAGLLHDIGKIGISEAILNKATKLTFSEFDEIKRHPELGARIISDVPFLKALVPMVLHHHEFYNGAGYPSGIAGEQIPFGARILSVADAYEAMTSDRPYRKSLPQEVAFSILRNEKGKQFDPDIVDAFLDLMRKNGYNTG